MAGNKPGPAPYEWDLEKIQAKGTPDGDCLIWTGAKGSGGYPMMRYESEMRTVSSVISQMKYGIVPNRQSKDKISRTCRNINCINADHIIIKNASQIMLDGKHCGVGARFTADQVRSIRKEYFENPYHGAQRDLAEKYGANSRHIWTIVHNKLYKWVED